MRRAARRAGALLTALLLAAAMSPARAQGAAPWQPRGTADLVLLDKIRAVPVPVQVKVGASTTYGSLTILVRSCAARPPDLPAESAAFLQITDSRAGGKMFQGWIMANAPSLSMYEDAVYDVRLMACR